MEKQRWNSQPLEENDLQATRPTVIPTPRANAIFKGWGVRF